MRDMYIGDFVNEEEAKESWENLVKRKQAESNQLSPVMRGLMLLAYGLVFFGLYYYLTK